MDIDSRESLKEIHSFLNLLIPRLTLTTNPIAKGLFLSMKDGKRE
jgi:hypothetical protein